MKTLLYTLALTSLMVCHVTHAAEETFDSYDTIVHELSTQKTKTVTSFNSEELPLHIGFGYVNSMSKINGPNIPIDKMTLQGAQVSMGLELFDGFTSQVQMTYLTTNTKNNTEMDAMEFDLMGLFRPHINRIMTGRIGAGLGIRNVDIKAPQTQTEFTNPLVLFIGGVEARLSQQVGIVTELTYKNALTDSNAEKYVIDLGVRIDGHF